MERVDYKEYVKQDLGLSAEQLDEKWAIGCFIVNKKLDGFKDKLKAALVELNTIELLAKYGENDGSDDADDNKSKSKGKSKDPKKEVYAAKAKAKKQEVDGIKKQMRALAMEKGLGKGAGDQRVVSHMDAVIAAAQEEACEELVKNLEGKVPEEVTKKLEDKQNDREEETDEREKLYKDGIVTKDSIPDEILDNKDVLDFLYEKTEKPSYVKSSELSAAEFYKRKYNPDDTSEFKKQDEKTKDLDGVWVCTAIADSEFKKRYPETAKNDEVIEAIPGDYKHKWYAGDIVFVPCSSAEELSKNSDIKDFFTKLSTSKFAEIGITGELTKENFAEKIYDAAKDNDEWDSLKKAFNAELFFLFTAQPDAKLYKKIVEDDTEELYKKLFSEENLTTALNVPENVFNNAIGLKIEDVSASAAADDRNILSVEKQSEFATMSKAIKEKTDEISQGFQELTYKSGAKIKQSFIGLYNLLRRSWMTFDGTKSKVNRIQDSLLKKLYNACFGTEGDDKKFVMPDDKSYDKFKATALKESVRSFVMTRDEFLNEAASTRKFNVDNAVQFLSGIKVPAKGSKVRKEEVEKILSEIMASVNQNYDGEESALEQGYSLKKTGRKTISDIQEKIPATDAIKVKDVSYKEKKEDKPKKEDTSKEDKTSKKKQKQKQSSK